MEEKYPVKEFPMTEKERNGRLMCLLADLIKEDNRQAVELIGTLVKDDSPSMRFSFNLVTENYIESTLPSVDDVRPRIEFHFCEYSRSMDQVYPRLCLKCKKPENEE